MPQIINTNLASINARRNLSSSQASLKTSLERLSSGLRVNSAKDDAAGLAISSRFQTQISGSHQAIRNANDAISFSQTVESSLGEVVTALSRIRDLAVQSANGVNSDSDRASLQAEVDQLVQEINRVARNTTFNGKQVLDGSGGDFNFHIGKNSNESVSFPSLNALASNLGAQPGLVQSTSGRPLVTSGSGDLPNIGIDERISNIPYWGSPATFVVGTENTPPDKRVDILAEEYGGDISMAERASYRTSNPMIGRGLAKSIVERINSLKAQGVEGLQDINASASNTFRASDIMPGDLWPGKTIDTTLGKTNIGRGSLEDGDLVINDQNIPSVNFEENDASGALVDAINSKSDLTGVVASTTEEGELQLDAEDGRDILIKTSSADVTNDVFGGGSNLTPTRFDARLDLLLITGKFTLSANDTILPLPDTTGWSEPVENQGAVGTIANADVSTVEKSNITIESVDSALKQINDMRSELGALQNRFESTVRNLASVSESLESANSRILDADYAKETSELTKSQVLQQAGISVLSQANALPQQVLALLE